MTAPVFRGEYDQLKSIAGTLKSQGDAIKAMNQRIKSAQQTLEGGDWIGEGAKKFYAEMNGQVHPALQRLSNALSEAGRVTQQIAQVTKQAEDDSAGCFHL
jgi:WXG100 family type VII secretion target